MSRNSAISLLLTSLLVLLPACADSRGAAFVQSASADSPWTVTLPTRRCGDYFIIDATINGRGPYAMILDSGASVTVLSKRVAREVGLRGRLDELKFNPVTVSNVRVQVRDLDHLEHAFNTDFDGIIGHPVFSKYTIIYDYPAGEVRLTSADLPEEGPGILRTPDPRHPRIPLRIGGRKTSAVVDTGSARTLSLEHLDHYDFESGPFALGVSTRINRSHIARAGRLAGNVTFGPITLSEPIVSESDDDNLLGQGVLRDFVVSFDQASRVIRFQRPDAPLSEPIHASPLYGHGAILKATAEGLLIRGLAEDSPAAQAGAHEGDLLIAVDGRSLADLGCAIREERTDIPRNMRWTLQRDGAPVDIELTTEVLIP